MSISPTTHRLERAMGWLRALDRRICLPASAQCAAMSISPTTHRLEHR